MQMVRLFGMSRGQCPRCHGLSLILIWGHLCIMLFFLINRELRGCNLRLNKQSGKVPQKRQVLEPCSRDQVFVTGQCSSC